MSGLGASARRRFFISAGEAVDTEALSIPIANRSGKANFTRGRAPPSVVAEITKSPRSARSWAARKAQSPASSPCESPSKEEPIP